MKMTFRAGIDFSSNRGNVLGVQNLLDEPDLSGESGQNFYTGY